MKLKTQKFRNFPPAGTQLRAARGNAKISAGTRPLAIQRGGTWFTFGWDITKNIWEVFGQNGYIRTSYSYDPFGNVSESGDVSQPFQWSSEFYDSELSLVYYNYRHYIPALGRWLSEDPIGISGGLNLYLYCQNLPIWKWDDLGEIVNDNISYKISFNKNLGKDVLGVTYVSPYKDFVFITSPKYDSKQDENCIKLSITGGIPRPISIVIADARDKATENHEKTHFNYYKDAWHELVALLNSYDGKIYCECETKLNENKIPSKAQQTIAYLKKAMEYYYCSYSLKSCLLDIEEYGITGRNQKKINEYIRLEAQEKELKKEMETLKNEA